MSDYGNTVIRNILIRNAFSINLTIFIMSSSFVNSLKKSAIFFARN